MKLLKDIYTVKPFCWREEIADYDVLKNWTTCKHHSFSQEIAIPPPYADVYSSSKLILFIIQNM